MARAKKHYIPGYVRHITHRCHKREFLLKFSKDRRRYLQWLYKGLKTIWSPPTTSTYWSSRMATGTSFLIEAPHRGAGDLPGKADIYYLKFAR